LEVGKAAAKKGLLGDILAEFKRKGVGVASFV
jgi:hypothetical protein